MTTPEIIASLEYGAAVLGVKVILVMEHGSCGAIEAVIASKSVPGQISALFPHLQPAVDQAGPDPDAAAKANAKIQADLLRKASTVISGMVNDGTLLVLSAFYNIASGEVALLDQPRTQVVKHAVRSQNTADVCSFSIGAVATGGSTFTARSASSRPGAFCVIGHRLRQRMNDQNRFRHPFAPSGAVLFRPYQKRTAYSLTRLPHQ